MNVNKASGLRRAIGLPHATALVVGTIIGASMLTIAASQIITNTLESLFGLSLVVIGLPVYYLWAKKHPQRS